MDRDYKVIVSAIIGNIDTGAIDKIKEKKIKIAIDLDLTNAEGDLERVKKKIQNMYSEAGKVIQLQDIKVSTKWNYEKAEQEITKVVAKYTDGQGSIISEGWKVAEVEETINGKLVKRNTLVKEEINYHQSSLQAQKEANAEVTRKNALMKKSNEMADSFLARSEKLAKTPEVVKGVGISQEMKALTSSLGAMTDPEKIKTSTNRLAELQGQLKTVNAVVGQSGHAMWSFGEQLKTAATRTLQYASTVGILYAALSQLRQGIQYIKELNKEMTSIQVVTGFSDEQIGNLSTQYNNLAKEMGVTTVEVAKSSTEWFRQGKTIEETSKLIETSMLMAKLGNISSAQSTEYLTSIINGFKLEAEDTTRVVDNLIALDNRFATSAGEIAGAMQRSSVSAQQAGLSMEELASMITVVSDVSRKAPESIGESFPKLW